jgi:hypothetical protein
MIEFIFLPFSLMIAYPFLSLIPSFILGGMYCYKRKKLIAMTAFLWFCYFIYETLNSLRITCSGECNIRVDLLLLAPLFYCLTALSLAIFFQSPPPHRE